MSFVELHPRCPSELQLDQLVVAELSADAAARVHRHMRRCSDCAGRVREIEAHRAVFAASSAVFAAVIPAASTNALPLARPRRRRHVAVACGTAIAMAAALALWLRLDRERDTTRIKGSGHHVEAFVVRDGTTWQAGVDEPVHPGDTLQIVVETEAHLAVVGTDGSGRVSRYFPRGELTERARALPSIRFDATLGAEEIVIAFCDRALPIDRALRECATEKLRVVNRGAPGRVP